MNEMKPISNSRNNIYKVAIILLVAYAAYSTAMRDLYRLQEVAIDVHEFTSDGLGELARVYSSAQSFAEGPQLASISEMNAVNEDPQVHIIAAGGSVELKGLDREPVVRTAIARPAKSSAAHGNTFSHSDTKAFKELARNFIAAGKDVACDSLKLAERSDYENDVQIKGLAHLPTRVAILRPRVHIESDSETTGSARDRARFRTVIKKIPAGSRNVRWPGVSEFKRVNEIVSMGRAAAKSAEADSDSVDEFSEKVPFHFVGSMLSSAISDEADRSEMHK